MNICITNHNSTLTLMYIRSKYPECTFDNGRLLFKKYNLSLSFHVQEISRTNGVSTAQILFEAEHPFFDVPALELSTGTAKNADQALNTAIDNYLMVFLESMFRSLDSSLKNTITSEFCNKKHIFYAPCECLSSTEDGQITDPYPLYSVVHDMIPQYLGTKKAYWIKLFASCSSGKVFCEATVNNSSCFELTSVLEQYAETWADRYKSHTEIQYLFFIQDDSTYQPYPFSFNQVKDYTLKTMELIKNTDKIKKIVDDVISICGDRSLAAELCSFIPEIYCTLAMNIREIDDIGINTDIQNLCLKKTQITSYGYIEMIIGNYLAEVHPSTEESMKIIRFSAKLSVIRKALDDGAKMDDLILSLSNFNFYDDYIFR